MSGMRVATLILAPLLLLSTTCAVQQQGPKVQQLTVGVVQKPIRAGMSQAEVAEALGSPNIFECSVNVSDFGSAVRVRANFQMRLINNKGELMEVQRVEDAACYQDFFSKVDKALFLAKEKL